MSASEELHGLIIERLEAGDNLQDVVDLLEANHTELRDRFLDENDDWLIRMWIEQIRKSWRGHQNQLQRNTHLRSGRERYPMLTKYVREHPRS